MQVNRKQRNVGGRDTADAGGLTQRFGPDFRQLLSGLGPKAGGVILYHIPQVTSVALSVEVIGRLKNAFPRQVIGVKDSSGSWGTAQALLKQHGDLHILVGDERLLAKAMNRGASGTICGLANIAPDFMQAPMNGIEEPRIDALVDILQPYGFTAAVKALVGHRRNDAVAWSRMRAPLRSLGETECRKIFAAVDDVRARRAA